MINFLEIRSIRIFAHLFTFIAISSCSAESMSVIDENDIEVLLESTLSDTGMRQLQSVSVSGCVITIDYSLNRNCSISSEMQVIGYTDLVDLSELSQNSEDIWRLPAQNGEADVVIWRYERSVRDVVQKVNMVFQHQISAIDRSSNLDFRSIMREISQASAAAGVVTSRSNKLCNGEVLTEPPMPDGFRLSFKSDIKFPLEELWQYSKTYCENYGFGN